VISIHPTWFPFRFARPIIENAILGRNNLAFELHSLELAFLKNQRFDGWAVALKINHFNDGFPLGRAGRLGPSIMCGKLNKEGETHHGRLDLPEHRRP
jgi:hypothetical protein